MRCSVANTRPDEYSYTLGPEMVFCYRSTDVDDLTMMNGEERCVHVLITLDNVNVTVRVGPSMLCGKTRKAGTSSATSTWRMTMSFKVAARSKSGLLTISMRR